MMPSEAQKITNMIGVNFANIQPQLRPEFVDSISGDQYTFEIAKEAIKVLLRRFPEGIDKHSGNRAQVTLGRFITAYGEAQRAAHGADQPAEKLLMTPCDVCVSSGYVNLVMYVPDNGGFKPINPKNPPPKVDWYYLTTITLPCNCEKGKGYKERSDYWDFSEDTHDRLVEASFATISEAETFIEKLKGDQ